jgi:hypothetical protein
VSLSSSTTRHEATVCPVEVIYRFGAGFEIREGTGAPRLDSLKALVALVHHIESAAQMAEAEGDGATAENHRAIAARLRRDTPWQCAIARRFAINLALRAQADGNEEA